MIPCAGLKEIVRSELVEERLLLDKHLPSFDPSIELRAQDERMGISAVKCGLDKGNGYKVKFQIGG